MLALRWHPHYAYCLASTFDTGLIKNLSLPSTILTSFTQGIHEDVHCD